MNWLSLLSENPFYELAIILLLAAVLSSIGQILRQPLIAMFIALGVIVGSAVLDVVKSKDNIHLLAETGIAVLLFIVGLKLDLRIIKSVGKIALINGLGQVLFTSQLVKSLRRADYGGKIFLTAMTEKDIDALSVCNADQLLLPHEMAATNFYYSFLLKLIQDNQMNRAQEGMA